jgi:hypothetical protein
MRSLEEILQSTSDTLYPSELGGQRHFVAQTADKPLFFGQGFIVLSVLVRSTVCFPGSPVSDGSGHRRRS